MSDSAAAAAAKSLQLYLPKRRPGPKIQRSHPSEASQPMEKFNLLASASKRAEGRGLTPRPSWEAVPGAGMDEAMNECVDEPGCASDLGDPACRHCLRAPEVGFPCPVQEGTAHGPRGRGPGSPGGSLLLSLPPESVRPQLPAGRKLGTRGDPLPPQPPAGLCCCYGDERGPGGALPPGRRGRSGSKSRT